MIINIMIYIHYLTSISGNALKFVYNFYVWYQGITRRNAEGEFSASGLFNVLNRPSK